MFIEVKIGRYDDPQISDGVNNGQGDSVCGVLRGEGSRVFSGEDNALGG